MNDANYIGLDVHQATISVTVLDAEGKSVKEAILETKAETVLQLIHGLSGSYSIAPTSRWTSSGHAQVEEWLRDSVVTLPLVYTLFWVCLSHTE